MNSTLRVATYDVDELHNTNNYKLQPVENKLWFLIHFVLKFPFNPPENIRKPLVF